MRSKVVHTLEKYDLLVILDITFPCKSFDSKDVSLIFNYMLKKSQKDIQLTFYEDTYIFNCHLNINDCMD